MTTYHNPWSESTHRPAANFADWFGPNPRGESEITNPYSGYPRETLALPDAYKGSNLYLTNIMLNLIQEEDLIPTRILLPMRVTQNETSVTWDEFRESTPDRPKKIRPYMSDRPLTTSFFPALTKSWDPKKKTIDPIWIYCFFFRVPKIFGVSIFLRPTPGFRRSDMTRPTCKRPLTRLNFFLTAFLRRLQQHAHGSRS